MTPAHGRLMASHQRWALPVLSGLTLAALVLPPAGHLGAWLVAGLAVAVLGIPHGALDAPLGMRIARRIGGAPATAVFLVAYGIVALAFLGLVSIAPMLALTLFLALAVVHFGVRTRWPGGGRGIASRSLQPGSPRLALLGCFIPSAPSSSLCGLLARAIGVRSRPRQCPWSSAGLLRQRSVCSVMLAKHA